MRMFCPNFCNYGDRFLFVFINDCETFHDWWQKVRVFAIRAGSNGRNEIFMAARVKSPRVWTRHYVAKMCTWNGYFGVLQNKCVSNIQLTLYFVCYGYDFMTVALCFTLLLSLFV